jgi:hypothetical protein
MQLKAKIVVSLFDVTGLAGNRVGRYWANMIDSIRLAYKPAYGAPSIDQIRHELKKFDADYDGSPYIFFYDERKYLLWQLKYSTVNNIVDSHT